MDRLSKQERRELRQQYKESVRQAVFPSIVVGPSTNRNELPPQAIVKHARKNFVGLDWNHVSGEHYFLYPRGSDGELGCDLYYGVITEELSADFVDLDELRDESAPIPLGTSCIGLSSQVNLHPVNRFVLMTAFRVIGRLTHGTLIDLGRNFIMDDWLSWSLDYMDKDMFKVHEVYDPDPADWHDLLAEFPRLRHRRFWIF